MMNGSLTNTAAAVLWLLAVVGVSAFRDDFGRGKENSLTKSFESANPRAGYLFRHLGQSTQGPVVQEIEAWPAHNVTATLGPTSGVSVDSRGLVYVLHRGPVEWNISSFDENKVYRYQESPITEPAVVVLDPRTGLAVRRWGQNTFFMPHGLYVDPEDNVWITDVALHQVFKYPRNKTSAELVLGEAFVPSSGAGHFCQPTAVVMSPSGLVFVADGYCNSRIAIFTPQGRHVTDIAPRDGLRVPHSLTYVHRDNVVCVADRENQRVLCFWAGLDPDFGTIRSSIGGRLGRVYAVASIGDYMYGVQMDGRTSAASGFRVELYPGSQVQTFSPRQAFIQPHDVAVSNDGRILYAVDVDAASKKKVYKFRI